MRTFVVVIAATCALGSCGSQTSSGSNTPQHTSTRTTSSLAASASVHSARLRVGARPKPMVHADPRTAAVITRLLTAVFVHPDPAQCTTTMTRRYVSQAFGADAARSGTSVITACREHQRLRARLPASERNVTVPDITMAGGEAHATVRGANGYRVAVTVAREGASWRLTGFSTAVSAPGQGAEIAPAGSLYAYRIPTGFIRGAVALGPVNAAGAAFSTAVAFAGDPSGGGIVVAQSAFRSGVHDPAALNATVPRLDHALRSSSVAAAVDPPSVGTIGGRQAVSWLLHGVRAEAAHPDGRITFVFSSAANAVVVTCRWPRTGPDRAALRDGCNAVLRTLSVG